jgi:hypothetical protein
MLLQKWTSDDKFQVCQISLLPTDSVILDHTVVSTFKECLNLPLNDNQSWGYVSEFWKKCQSNQLNYWIDD